MHLWRLHRVGHHSLRHRHGSKHRVVDLVLVGGTHLIIEMHGLRPILNFFTLGIALSRLSADVVITRVFSVGPAVAGFELLLYLEANVVQFCLHRSGDRILYSAIVQLILST